MTTATAAPPFVLPPMTTPAPKSKAKARQRRAERRSRRDADASDTTEAADTTEADAAEDDDPESYTIDELAAATAIPSRTIRFYQSSGVLPKPEKRGRVAFYGPAHL